MRQVLIQKKNFWHFARLTLTFLLAFVLLENGIAQQHTVSGVITDENNVPLPGVNVVIKGSTSGTVSDIDGKYSVSAAPSAVLTFSFVGYEPQEIEVGDKTTINVILKEEVKQLNEVVVIGYGVQKKSDLTGAVASVKADDMKKMAVTNVANALQGRAAGVQVMSNTGAPGSGTTFLVHGISTLTSVDGTNQSKPMWIVDGVPAGTNTVSPDDIESVEILKDASSAAIYGSNGGSGVVLITTKKGKAGKVQSSLNYYHGIQDVSKRLDMANGPDFGKMYTEMLATKYPTGISATDPNVAKMLNFNSLPTNDYQSMVLRSAAVDKIDFSASGGTDRFTAYFGIGLIKQEGILVKSDFSKFNFRINSDYKITKWFKVGENISFNQRSVGGLEEWEYQNEYRSYIISAISVHPYLSPYIFDSTQMKKNFNKASLGATDPPFAAIDNMNKKFRYYEGNAVFYATIEPFKGMSLETRISNNLNFSDDYNFTPTYNYGAGPGQYNYIPTIKRGWDKYTDYTWQNIASYNTSFFNDLNFGATFGYEVGQSEDLKMAATRYYPYSEDPDMWYFDACRRDTLQAAQLNLNTGSGSKSAGYSYIGRINLDFKGKYLIQGNYRRDYSSKFGPNMRRGDFYGGSVGWKFSEEKFIKESLTFLSFGKIRYGYGEAGNNAIPNYAYYATLNNPAVYSYSFGNTGDQLISGTAPDVLANPSVHWETIITQNAGIDLAFLDNRLSLTVDRFIRKNDGMLIRKAIPGVAGWTIRDTYQEGGGSGTDSRPIVNEGKLSNKGWEVTLGWKDQIGKFRYSIDANYTYVKNIAEDLGADTIHYGGGSRGLTAYFTRTKSGGEIGEFYGYKVEKIFGPNDEVRYIKKGKNWVPIAIDQTYTIKANGDTVFAQPSAQRGDFKFADVNNDGQLTEADKVDLGNPYAKNLLGVTFNFEYGIFDMSMFWYGAFGNKIFNSIKYYTFNTDGNFNWSEDYINNHYRDAEVIAKRIGSGEVIATYPQNTSAKYPRLDPNNSNGNFSNVSDFYLEDGSYMRLKNLQFGVSMPSKWVKKVGLSQFRIYVGGQNLLTFTKYSGMDPEINYSDPYAAGIDKAAYPNAKVYQVGVNVKF